MSIKSRIEALEAVKGGALSFKVVRVEKDGTFLESQTNKLLTKDADGKFYYSDGIPLHGEAKEENAITLEISNNGK